MPNLGLPKVRTCTAVLSAIAAVYILYTTIRPSYYDSTHMPGFAVAPSAWPHSTFSAAAMPAAISAVTSRPPSTKGDTLPFVGVQPNLARTRSLQRGWDGRGQRYTAVAGISVRVAGSIGHTPCSPSLRSSAGWSCPPGGKFKAAQTGAQLLFPTVLSETEMF